MISAINEMWNCEVLEVFKSLIFDKRDLGRNQIILFVFFVWFLQLWWSKYWLDHFNYGPLELIWRKLTYSKTK